MKQAIVSFLVCLVAFNVFAQTPVRRMLEPRDVLRMKQVRQPKVSPDGNWILYTVSRVDSIKDKNLGKLFMTSWDGKETVGLT